MATLELLDAEAARNSITTQQRQQIKKLYESAVQNIQKEIVKLEGKDNVSSIMRTAYLQDLQHQLQIEIDRIGRGVIQITTNGMLDVSQAVVENTLSNLGKLGFKVSGMLSHVPTNVVSNIANGKVYQGGWNLSQRIWGIENKHMQDIHNIIAQGIAQNKSVYDIAKDLEKYVDPNAVKPWDWSKVYPGTNRKIDYNAQRLARTLTQHAFQQATIAANNPNPFIDGYIWLSACIEGRTCETCMDRDGSFYPKDVDIPLDHPNGLCTIAPHVSQNLQDVANQIADWVEEPEGTYPELDAYYLYLRTH